MGFTETQNSWKEVLEDKAQKLFQNYEGSKWFDLGFKLDLVDPWMLSSKGRLTKTAL